MSFNSFGISRRREILALVLTCVLVLTTLSLSSFPTRSLSIPIAWSAPVTPTLETIVLPAALEIHAELDPLELLAQLYEEERTLILTGYDQAATEALVRSPPGALNPDFDVYISRLETFVDTWFNGSDYHLPLTSALSRLVTAFPPPVEHERFEKTLYTFDKGGAEGVPGEFEWWKTRLGDRDWDIKVGDDVALEEWFGEVTGQSEGQDGAALWREMWDGLGRPVLKSDLLR